MYSSVKFLSLATLCIVITDVALCPKEWKRHSDCSNTNTTSDTAGTGGLGMLAAVLTPWGLIAAIITAVVYKGKKHPMTDAADQGLRFVMRAVHDVVDNWEGIVSCLRVKTVENIKRECQRAERWMIAILSPCLKTQILEHKAPNPSWKRIVADHIEEEDPAHANDIVLNYNACSSASARTEMIQQIPDKRCRVIELLQLESLLTRTNQLIFSSRGGKYHSEDDDFTLTVPEGAVPTGDSISIQFGVVAYGPVGPFKYPYGVRPVSPIVWLCSTPKFEFQKPIEVSLPHCLDCNDEDDCRSLTFLKADHTANQDSKLFHFELTDGKVSFALNTSYGTLSTTHFCMYCVGEYTREDTDKALYCVVVARPLRMEKISQVYFCLTYFLRTCLKLVEGQFDGHYDLSKNLVRLVEGPNGALEITIKRNESDSEANGWHIQLHHNKISAREVCFWDYFPSARSLVLACDNGMYPPRSILEIFGEENRSASRIVVEISGATTKLSEEIPLPQVSFDSHPDWSSIPILPDQLGQPIQRRSDLPQHMQPSIGGVILTEGDLHILTEILRPAAPQWREVGGALGILESDLDIIQRRPLLIVEGPPGYLREVLKQCLKWAPPNHGWPTIEALALAVQSTGQESLAVNLKSLFLQKKGNSGSPLSDQLHQPIQRRPDFPQHKQLSLELEAVEEELLTFSATEERTFDHRKGQGFVLHVPKGAVLSSDCTIKVKSYVARQSTPKFIFPEGSKLVSGVYHITASRKLLKPVSIQIEHCADVKGDSQYAELEVAIADSTTGPPYHFKAYKGGNIRVLDSYIEVELAQFSLVSCLLRLLRAIREPASIHYCGLVCCLRSSELTRTWEYHIVLIRNLQLYIRVIENEYAGAESMQKLSVEFEEGNALTVDNVSVEGTAIPGGWRVATKWDPSRIEKEEADNFEPGRNIPKCCVLASCTTGETTTVEALRYVLKFSGTRKPKSYLLSRDVQSEQNSRVSLFMVAGAARHSISTPGTISQQKDRCRSLGWCICFAGVGTIALLALLMVLRNLTTFDYTWIIWTAIGGIIVLVIILKQSGGHLYFPMPSGKHSPEFETLFLHQADLADHLGDYDGVALRLANKLLEMHVIGKATRDAADVRGPHVTEIMRVNPIIKAILASIDVNPAKYQQFREALLHRAVGVDPDIVNAYVPALTVHRTPTPATTKLTPEDLIPSTQPQQITAPSQIQQPTANPESSGVIRRGGVPQTQPPQQRFTASEVNQGNQGYAPVHPYQPSQYTASQHPLPPGGSMYTSVPPSQFAASQHPPPPGGNMYTGVPPSQYTDPGPLAPGLSSQAHAESSGPGVIRRGDRPTLPNLNKFPVKHGKPINIPVQIGINYRTFGTFLLEDDNGAVVSVIERTMNFDPERINGDILMRWIRGQGKKPITWGTLITCLRDLELETLASDIEEALQ